MATYQIYEILEQARLATSKKETIKVLKMNQTWCLQQVLKGAFDPSIEFYRSDAPNGYVPDIHAAAQMSYSNLYKDMSKMYLFTKGSCNLRKERIDQLFIQFLESLEAKEAQIILNMMGKDLKISNLTKEVVLEAFPGLF
jgi:hypothetical protein